MEADPASQDLTDGGFSVSLSHAKEGVYLHGDTRAQGF